MKLADISQDALFVAGTPVATTATLRVDGAEQTVDLFVRQLGIADYAKLCLPVVASISDGHYDGAKGAELIAATVCSDAGGRQHAFTREKAGQLRPDIAIAICNAVFEVQTPKNRLPPKTSSSSTSV